MVKGKWGTKNILILEKEKYRYQSALFDLSGSDIRHHKDEPINLVKVVRDWFITELFNKGPSYKRIWYQYNEFMADLDKALIKEGYEEGDIVNIPIPEIMSYINEWLEENKNRN